MSEIFHLNGGTWLVCGGRNFTDQAMFDSVMIELCRAYGCPSILIEGGARGTDAMAADWAARMAINHRQMRADWVTHGRAAGPIRNQQMLDKGKPNLVIAFPGGKGTADMVERARHAGTVVATIQVAAPAK